MLEIKAFIRVNMLDKVVQALESAGITNMTVIDVRAIWRGLREEDLRYSLELAQRYMNVAKLETLVRDEDAGRVMELIRNAARTGRPGDGIIYAVPVQEAVHIRTGRRGEAAFSGSE
jgi:nitrogen regulatory protein P-II 1